MKRRTKVMTLLVLAMSMLLCACGAKYGPEDAKAYAKSCLDASYKGEFTEYVKLTDSTEEEAQEMYDNGIDLTMEASEILTSGVSQELQDKYRQLFIDLYKSAKYTLGEAKEDGDDGFTVVVTVEPFTIFDGLDTELTAKLEELAANLSENPTDEEINELVYQAMYDLMIAKMGDNMTYGDPVDVTLHVLPDEDGVYYIPEDDLYAVENAMVPQ